MAIVPLVRLVFDVGRVNRDTTGFLFRSFVDLSVVSKGGTATLGKDLSYSRCKSGLSMIDVSNGANVHERLVTGERLRVTTTKD